jgi:aspartate aminotransferase-like enzyme
MDVREKTFRIGNMGHVPFEDIREMFENLGEVIDELKS